MEVYNLPLGRGLSAKGRCVAAAAARRADVAQDLRHALYTCCLPGPSARKEGEGDGAPVAVAAAPPRAAANPGRALPAAGECEAAVRRASEAQGRHDRERLLRCLLGSAPDPGAAAARGKERVNTPDPGAVPVHPAARGAGARGGALRAVSVSDVAPGTTLPPSSVERPTASLGAYSYILRPGGVMTGDEIARGEAAGLRHMKGVGWINKDEDAATWARRAREREALARALARPGAERFIGPLRRPPVGAPPGPPGEGARAAQGGAMGGIRVFATSDGGSGARVDPAPRARGTPTPDEVGQGPAPGPPPGQGGDCSSPPPRTRNPPPPAGTCPRTRAAPTLALCLGSTYCGKNRVLSIYPWVASRASMLYLAARTHKRAAACLRAAHIAALREFWTD